MIFPYFMHFTISNSHIFNFSATRLYSKGHSTNYKLSSFTIHIVVYLLNKYLLRPPLLPGILPIASPGAHLWDHEFFVPCTVAQWSLPVVFRKAGRRRQSSSSSNPLFLCIITCSVFVINTPEEKRSVFTHALTLRRNYSKEKSFEGGKCRCFHFKHLF